MKKSIANAVVAVALFVQPAIAKSVVVCQSNSGKVEMNLATASANGRYLVIANSYLISEFMDRGFITQASLNNRGELVVPLDSAEAGQISNLYFGLYADGMGGYILTVRNITDDGHGLGPVLANYHFMDDCHTVTQQI